MNLQEKVSTEDYKITDYAGNIMYETTKNSTVTTNKTRILVDGGYYEGGVYYFYINDHLGNNRIVANAAASVVQSTQYYPFGMPFADATGAGAQPYKYNNKELDGRNGLNWYDYSARYLALDIPVMPMVDPLAEKFYSISPYVYCLNNPIRLIDPDGKAPMGGPGWPVNPVDYQRMVASQKVDQTIKANSSTIQKNGALAVASLSDINDAVVLGTTITRGSSGAVNVDGTPAGGIGVGFAALGAVLPAISGSAVKRFFKSIGKALGIGGDAAKTVNTVGDAANVAENIKDGAFSVLKWDGYPAGGVKPSGTLRVLEDTEYIDARNAANSANAAIRKADPEALKGSHIHEVKPVKFGGSPTDLSNKIYIPPTEHSKYTNFWNSLLRDLNNKK